MKREVEYKFSKELDYFDVKKYPYYININENKKNVIRKRNVILNSFKEAGINIINGEDINSNNGVFELIEIGSTSRNTNCFYNFDFDFVLIIDKDIYEDEQKYENFRNKLNIALPNIKFRDKYTARNQTIYIKNEKVVIDLSIIHKEQRQQCSTDKCISDMLKKIRAIDLKKYNLVLENIILAKEVLKKAGVYNPKTKKSFEPQGGLGGVGIENWIIQHGGSFREAATNFLKFSKGKSFSEFSLVYKIWDLGRNRFYDEKQDEFVSKNMNNDGYNKMVHILKEFIKNDHKTI